ncbi:MAG: hypothetical protein ACE5JA_03145 [bacterium]
MIVKEIALLPEGPECCPLVVHIEVAIVPLPDMLKKPSPDIGIRAANVSYR